MLIRHVWIWAVVLMIAGFSGRHALLGDTASGDFSAPEPGPSVLYPSESFFLASDELVERFAGQETSSLARFYREDDYRLVWTDGQQLGQRGRDLLYVLESSAEYGLAPADYLPAQARDDDESSPAPYTETEIELTQGLLNLAQNIYGGRVDPSEVRGGWPFEAKRRELSVELKAAVREHDLDRALKSLEPPHEGYSRLKAALAGYRKIAASGLWKPAPAGPSLKPDMCDQRVGAVREMLVLLGDHPGRITSSGFAPLYKKNDENWELFDDRLESAVKSFQLRHGIEADGEVGPQTLAALNVPPEERIVQIELNMERWRWMPDSLEDRFVWANIPGYTLEIRNHGRLDLRMKTVVGIPGMRTPLLKSEMDYLVLNPHWNVPANIALNELVPEMKDDPNYLKDRNIRVFDRGAMGSGELSSEEIDWAEVGSDDFNYLLRQDPGPGNSLGRLKFKFPNPHGVALHDTPLKTKFEQAYRAQSHGCVRVERPWELARYVLQKATDYDPLEIEWFLSSKGTKKVHLDESLGVYFLYFTSWVDDDGRVQFRNDVYGYDKDLKRALDER